MGGCFDKKMQMLSKQRNGEDSNKTMLLTKIVAHFDHWLQRKNGNTYLKKNVGPDDHVFEVMGKLRLVSNLFNCSIMFCADIQ